MQETPVLIVLVNRARAGDRRAVSDLATRAIAHCRRALVAFASWRGLSTQDVEDAAARGAFKLLSKLERLEQDSAALRYARAVARRWLVRRAMRLPPEVPLDQACNVVVWRESEERDAIDRRRVRLAIGALPPILRRALLLRLRGMTFREIGEVEHVSLKTAQSRVRLALDRLKRSAERLLRRPR